MKNVVAVTLSATVLSVAGGAAGQFEHIEGRWEGSWFNNEFFSTGSWVSDISTAGSEITITTDLGGFVFGGDDPDPATSTVTINPDDTIDFGLVPDVMGTFDGVNISTVQTNVNGGAAMGGFDRVTFDGSFNGDSFTATYQIFFLATDSVPFADGVVNLRRIPSPASMALLGLGGLICSRRGR